MPPHYVDSWKRIGEPINRMGSGEYALSLPELNH